jgi:hypothetical protein
LNEYASLLGISVFTVDLNCSVDGVLEPVLLVGVLELVLLVGILEPVLLVGVLEPALLVGVLEPVLLVGVLELVLLVGVLEPFCHNMLSALKVRERYVSGSGGNKLQ